MKLWHVASLTAVILAADASTASAFHPLLHHPHHHHKQPQVILVPGVATTPQVVTQSFAVQSGQSFSFAAPQFAPAPAQMFSLGSGCTGAFALQPAQSFYFPAQNFSAGGFGSPNADAQALAPLLIRNLIRTFLDEPLSPPSGDLSRRVRDLEDRVDILERNRDKSSSKHKDSDRGNDKKDRRGSEKPPKQEEPDAASAAAAGSAGGRNKHTASELETLLQSFARLEEARELATLNAQRTLRNLEYRQSRTAEEIRMLKEYLTPAGGATAPKTKP